MRKFEYFEWIIWLSYRPLNRNPDPESAKFLLVESGILGFGIWNTAQGIRNLKAIFGIRKLSSRSQYLESGLHGVESRIQDCLGFPYMGRLSPYYLQHWSRERLGMGLFRLPADPWKGRRFLFESIFTFSHGTLQYSYTWILCFSSTDNSGWIIYR